MEAALRAGVERIVYTSSVAALALPAGRQAADETTALAETAAIGAYKRSKVAAQDLVEAMIARDALPAVIVNPSTPIGPRDIRPTPTGRIIVEAASGRMPGYVDTGLNLVHVDDVAAGHLAALVHGKIGERYILGGQDVLARRHAARHRASGRAQTAATADAAADFSIPAAAMAEMIANRTGREPFLTLDGLRMAKNRMFFTSAKAQRGTWASTPRPYAGRTARTPSSGFAARDICDDGAALSRRSRARPGSTCCSFAADSGARPNAMTRSTSRRPPRGRAWLPSCLPATRPPSLRQASLRCCGRTIPANSRSIVVDDHSTDGTAAIARHAAAGSARSPGGPLSGRTRAGSSCGVDRQAVGDGSAARDHADALAAAAGLPRCSPMPTSSTRRKR